MKKFPVESKQSKKIVIFGAGKIGRSFIGQVFSQGGYEIVFVEKTERIVQALNHKKSYQVVVRDATERIIVVENVRGIHISDIQTVNKEISTVDLIAVCVGQEGLNEVARLLAQALVAKRNKLPQACTDIILAENLRNASLFFAELMRKYLPPDFPLWERVGLIETSIGKMVPIVNESISQKNPLIVFAESYNTLIVDKKGFKNSVPSLPDLAPKENIEAWVDRKLFIHNLGHAMAAYFGNFLYPDKEYLYDVLDDPEVETLTRAAMQESGRILMAVHPGEFTKAEIDTHIDDLICRFKNRHLRDTVYRVGSDLKRKLGRGDRVATPLKFAHLYKLPCETILQGYVCALSFRAFGPDGQETPGDEQIRGLYKKMGLAFILKEISGMDSETILYLLGKKQVLPFLK